MKPNTDKRRGQNGFKPGNQHAKGREHPHAKFASETATIKRKVLTPERREAFITSVFRDAMGYWIGKEDDPNRKWIPPCSHARGLISKWLSLETINLELGEDLTVNLEQIATAIDKIVNKPTEAKT